MTLLLAQAAPAFEGINPIGVLEDATKSVPGFEGGLSAALNIVLLLTVLTIAPSILILCTCFTRMAWCSAFSARRSARRRFRPRR